MSKKKELKASFNAEFSSLNINEQDPTIIKGKVIIHDFEKSWNNHIVTEEVCNENLSTLIGKRVVCKYIPIEENDGVDALGSHEETIIKDRDTGEDMIATNTIAIGFIENAYIGDYTDKFGITKKVLFGDIILWNDEKYGNIVSLLYEWLNKGIPVHMSVEYLYRNYNVIDGISYIQSPILYVAHTILNSEQRGSCAEVSPAYDIAQLLSVNEREMWNKAVAQAIEKTNNDIQNQQTVDVDIKNNSQKEENENMAENKFYKALCELSHGDIKSQIMTALSKVMSADEFSYVWVSSYAIYDTYFVYENYEDGKWVYYKVNYTKTETDVSVDLATKVLVTRDQVWVEVTTMETQMNSLKTEIQNLKDTIENSKVSTNEVISKKENELNSLNSTIEALKDEKSEIENKFNTISETVISLNSKIEEMKPIVEQYNKEQYEKALSEKKSFYEVKFNSVKSIDKFNSEEVQELIKESLNDDEEGKKATLQLNSMIVELIPTDDGQPSSKTKVVKEFNSKLENLIPSGNDFETRYGFK